MELVENIPGFTKSDRLGLTVFGSVLAHMVAILGISFSVPDLESDSRNLPSLEITLVNSRSDVEPEKAEFLAQANQDGGGDTDQPVIAKSPLPLVPAPVDSEQIPIAHIAPRPSPTAQPERVIMTQDKDQALTVAKTDNQPLPLNRDKAEDKIGLVENPQARKERSRLSAEINQFWEQYQKRPRRKFLSARTKEYKYAAYMEAWRTKVERVGNLNYPEQARKNKLTGHLVLDVEIKSNGALHAINVIRPSGYKVLDDAAVRIVRLSAPFDPFPSSIKKEVDILHITRTWKFLRGSTLTSR